MSTSLAPRLPTSQKWTELPKEFLAKVRTVFNGQFGPEAEHGEFLVDGRVYPKEVIVRIGYLENGRLKQINFEASMDLPERTDEDEQAKAMERLYTCIDALGSCMEEYFELGEDEETEIPLRWKAYDIEGEVVYLQHSTVNTRLEEEADRLLGLSGSLGGGPEKALVREEAPTEDALGNADVDNELAFDVQQAIRSGRYLWPVDKSDN